MRSVCRSLCIFTFVIFKKQCFEIENINLSNTTKLILLNSLLQEAVTGEIKRATFFYTNKPIFLDSLLQEVPPGKIQIGSCLTRPSLCCLIHCFKRFPLGSCTCVLVSKYWGRRHLSEDSEIVNLSISFPKTVK